MLWGHSWPLIHAWVVGILSREAIWLDDKNGDFWVPLVLLTGPRSGQGRGGCVWNSFSHTYTHTHSFSLLLLVPSPSSLKFWYRPLKPFLYPTVLVSFGLVYFLLSWLELTLVWLPWMCSCIHCISNIVQIFKLTWSTLFHYLRSQYHSKVRG